MYLCINKVKTNFSRNLNFQAQYIWKLLVSKEPLGSYRDSLLEVMSQMFNNVKMAHEENILQVSEDKLT